ncbi:MAG: MFS transporter [Bacteroidia bacterium]|jgi:FHS family L-fucose permease-like MFS transporter
MSSNRSQLYSVITIFFFWGFIAASNGILIPFCKGHLALSQFQSQLIDLTFYGGYFIGSALLFLYTRVQGQELLNRIGLKKGIVYGLLLSALGAACIIPSVHLESYPLILGSYFIIALGFSLQQTSAQPYVIALGSSETGAHRLNLAGGINSLGTTIGPVVLSYVLFGGAGGSATEATFGSISGLYIGVTLLFVTLAVFFGMSKMPDVKSTEPTEPGFGALKSLPLRLGMIAIFVYVGVEVSIQSNMGALLQLPEFGGYSSAQLAPFISMYWGSLMIGRWTGSLAVFELNGFKKIAFQMIVPFLAFGIVLLVNHLNGNEIQPLYGYAVALLLMVGVTALSRDNQAKAMIYFSLFGLAAMLVGILSTGTVAIYAFLSGGLACSVLWPCIFSLSIQGLGKYTSQGSAFLIMMILGGAIIPPLQGWLADMPSIGIHQSYWITVLCFAYLAWFGRKLS